MTAEVEILIANLENVLTVPVSAVVVKGDQFFGYVQSADGPQKRELLLGLSNDKFVEVKDGVAEGEEILMNPRAVMGDQLNDEDGEEEDGESEKVSSRFGDTSNVPAPSSTGGKKPSGGGSGSSGGARKTPSFASLDKNGDKKVTSDEITWPGADAMISKIDKDGDGAISETEWKNRPKRPSSGGGSGAGGGRPESGAR